MIKQHEFSLSEIDEMVPYEREVYVILIKKFIEEEKKRLDEQRSLHK